MQKYYTDEDNSQKQQKVMKNVMKLKRSQEEVPAYSEYTEYECEEEALLASLNIDKSKQQFLRNLQKSTYSEKTNVHKVFICVVCDNFIIGKEKVCWSTMSLLLKNEERLSIRKYQEQFQCILPDALRKQYLISNILLKNMLLSPRASLDTSENKDGEREN